jgi:hypothetical protein
MQTNNGPRPLCDAAQRIRLKAKHSTAHQNEGATNGGAQQAHGRRHRAPEVHEVLDYALAAIIIAGPIVFDFDSTAATVIALAFGAAAAVLAVGTPCQLGSCELDRASLLRDCRGSRPAGDARAALVNLPPPTAKLSGKAEEQHRLRGDISEPARCSKGDVIGPLEPFR